jgi:arsenate reductase (thioredoxin)
VKERVLILCTGNSARSQMAEGLLRASAGGRFEVHSAGTRPSSVRPEAVEAMREVGVDISSHRSLFDHVLTVCDNARENCPVFPGRAARAHWSFDDPAAVEGDWETRLAAFRRVRDEIRARLSEWAGE